MKFVYKNITFGIFNQNVNNINIHNINVITQNTSTIANIFNNDNNHQEIFADFVFFKNDLNININLMGECLCVFIGKNYNGIGSFTTINYKNALRNIHSKFGKDFIYFIFYKKYTNNNLLYLLSLEPMFSFEITNNDTIYYQQTICIHKK